jgi:hypothetical protein
MPVLMRNSSSDCEMAMGVGCPRTTEIRGSGEVVLRDIADSCTAKIRENLPSCGTSRVLAVTRGLFKCCFEKDTLGSVESTSTTPTHTAVGRWG